MEAKQERRMSRDLNEEIKKDWNSLKDAQSLDEVDLDKIDLVRGDTPPDIKDQCLKLCQDYLAGNWAQQTIDTIEVKRISGGLTNQIYYCGLINKCEEEVDIPQEVAIRLYGPKYWDSCDNETNERLSDIIIGIMVSENGLGPKIYGIHESGQIHKFYKHKQFREELQNDKHLVNQVFQKLAGIHLMDVPIKKNTNWVQKSLEKFFKFAFDNYPIKKEIEELNLQTLKNNDLRKELDWMYTIAPQAKSPLVFTHNDYRSSNILVTEPNNEIVVCDFEYGSYGYRGYDFVNLMREWGRNPFDFKVMGELPPPDHVFRPLIEIYVEECIRIKGKSYAENPINSVDHILKEVKIYILYSLLFFAVFLLKNDENNNDMPMPRKVTMGFADLCFKAFFTIKKKLIDQKIIV